MPLSPASSSSAKNGKPCQISTIRAGGKRGVGIGEPGLVVTRGCRSCTSMSLITPSRGSSISAHMWPATTLGRNQGSSTSTPNSLKPGRPRLSDKRRGQPEQQLASHRADDPDRRVLQRQPEDRVVGNCDVVLQADEAGAEVRPVEPHLAEAEPDAPERRVDHDRQDEEEARDQQEVGPVAALGEVENSLPEARQDWQWRDVSPARAMFGSTGIACMTLVPDAFRLTLWRAPCARPMPSRSPRPGRAHPRR